MSRAKNTSHSLHIQVTSDYDKFEMFPSNRDVRKMKPLEDSFRKHGWIPAYPAHVERLPSGKLRIKDGHRRFTIAKKLGIPILYIVTHDDATIPQLEETRTSWSVDDYLQHHVRNGIPPYAIVREYRDRTGIPLGLCIGLLGGQTSASNFTKRFKDGTFTVSKSPLAETVAEIVEVCRGISEAAALSLFVQALARCVLVPQFDVERFEKKLRVFGSALVKAPTLDGYTKEIEEIYNCHAPRGKQLNVAFLADQAARERKAAKKR